MIEITDEMCRRIASLRAENERLRTAMTRVENHLRCDGFVDFADALERIRTATEEAHEQKEPPPVEDTLCEGCPPVGYPTDETRCTPCPRRP